jgi:hypothetical protein
VTSGKEPPRCSVQCDVASADTTTPESPARRVWRALLWLRAFSWPRRFPVVQFPNLPLALAFAAGEVARHTRGSVHASALAVSYLAMAVWAWLELTEGVNWFRRLLGAWYTASTMLHLTHALHR